MIFQLKSKSVFMNFYIVTLPPTPPHTPQMVMVLVMSKDLQVNQATSNLLKMWIILSNGPSYIGTVTWEEEGGGGGEKGRGREE